MFFIDHIEVAPKMYPDRKTTQNSCFDIVLSLNISYLYK